MGSVSNTSTLLPGNKFTESETLQQNDNAAGSLPFPTADVQMPSLIHRVWACLACRSLFVESSFLRMPCIVMCPSKVVELWSTCIIDHQLDGQRSPVAGGKSKPHCAAASSELKLPDFCVEGKSKAIQGAS